MKKVLKLSSLLAAVLLLAALGGVQLLTAQVRTDVNASADYVSNDKGATNTFTVTVTDSRGWVIPTVDKGKIINGLTVPTTTVTVTNKATNETFDLVVTATTSTNTWEATVRVLASTSTPYVAEAVKPSSKSGEWLNQDVVASDGDVIQLSYQSEGSVASYSDLVTVDGTGPVLSNVSPSHGTRTKTGTLIFTVDISDAGVGVGDQGDVEASAVFNLKTLKETFNGTASDQGDGSWRVTKLVTLPQGRFPWYITIADTLGNSTQSDAVADDKEEDATETLQDYTIVVDLAKPTIDSAVTGSTLDTSGDSAVAKVSNDRKSIAVVFDDGGPDGGGLNGDTVDETDFLVLVDKQQQDIASVAWHEDVPLTVFITLETELAGDDTPTVRVVRGIEDVAGNEQASTEETATDGIAPMLTVSIVGTADDNPVTNGEIKVRVSADEDSINPNAKTGAVATLVTDKKDEDGSSKLSSGNAGASFRTITPNQSWEWTFDFDDKDDGLYNVCVTIKDITDGANEVTAGLCGDAVDTGSDDILVFEVDTDIDVTIADVITFTGTDATETDNAGSFIEIDMTGEGSEYTGDSHGTITALSATVGGDDAEVSTLDDKKFTVSPPAGGYAVGEHDVIVTATDETGNTKTFSAVTLEITARAPFKINLRPGFNLISLPGTPANTNINDVIGADHSINQVLTYSPFVEGGWLSAERGDDGAFTGTLTTIDGSTAYIVRTTSFEPLEIVIPRMALGAGVLPPQTNLAVGWNLVPVIDLSSDLKSGGTIEDYFQGVGDAILTIGDSGRLEAVDGDDGDVGKGYWVYASRPAVLLPTSR